MKLPRWCSANQRTKLMLDYLLAESRHTPLDLARCLFFFHGQDLADAAARLGGPHCEERVVSCALEIETASQMNHRIRRELAALHRLLSLEDVGHPERLETVLFTGLDLANSEVEEICLLTDLLAELLSQIDCSLASRACNGSKLIVSAN
ncbi:MAG: hypothetical protein ACU0FF_12520 [Sulfitobacter sp.]|uniref:hypothetical protein n=2 Tax=Sulfitobacter sp. TaxID=1903071 RepID=UPI0040596817